MTDVINKVCPDADFNEDYSRNGSRGWKRGKVIKMKKKRSDMANDNQEFDPADPFKYLSAGIAVKNSEQLVTPISSRP